MKKNKKLLGICLLAALLLIVCAVVGVSVLSVPGSTEPSETTEPTEEIEVPILSVKEVLQTEDLTHVVFDGIVTGYDYGKRHIIIEDVDGSCAIQLYKNPGFARAKVGDLVRIDGYRTYDKSLDRITPNSLEILSSGNPCTADEPIVLDSSEVAAWTNENRTNAGIMFKTYTFTNVEINTISASYTYIDSQYDEEGGRGLKIGIKNDGCYVDIADLKLVQGQKYNITGILYGVSDDFKDENRDGIVLRMSVLSVDDVELVVENPDEVTFLVSGQRSFLLEDKADKPDFTRYFTVIDPVDGAISVTEDMITENVDMTAVGTYPVTFTYTNSVGDVLTKTIHIYVTENGMSVSEALKLVPEYSDAHVHGVVIGWSYKDSQKTAMVIEDPETGEAIEMWVNNKSDFQKLNVGDHILMYSSALGYEKELPRLSGDIKVIRTLETGVSLTPAKQINSLSAWSSELAKTKGNFFGRYTFTAEFIKTKGNYSYFLNATSKTGNIIQLALYQSATPYDFITGYTYEVTVVAVGISDGYSALSEKSIVVRLSIMNEEDIKIVDTNLPMSLEAGNHGISVSEAIDLMGTGQSAFINGYVAGFVKNADGNHTAVILQDTVTGECIEFWANDHSNHRNVWNTYAVGDHVVIYTDKIISNKGLPRAGEEKKKTEPVMVGNSYKISTGNAIRTVNIPDMEAFLQDAIANGTNILGKYSYTGTITNEDGYLYVTNKSDGRTLKLDLYNSPVSASFEYGKKYSVTFLVLAYSKAVTTEENITLRIAILNQSDVQEVFEIPDDTGYLVRVEGATELLVGTAKPDFTTYFTVVDAVDGQIPVTKDMITDNVDMSKVGTYEVKLSCKNSKGKQISETVEIKVTESLSVSEAIKLLGTDSGAYINGFVAGFVKNGDGNHTAVILQDTVTGECIEFWANDHSNYREIWNTYAVGDHVVIHTDKIVSNKGLPRAGEVKKQTSPVMVGNSYKLSTGNAIKTASIADMEDFLRDAIDNGTNILGKYTYTGAIFNDGGYLYVTDKEDGHQLKLELYNSPVSARFEKGKRYQVTFLILAYSKALSTQEDISLRIAILDENDIEEVFDIPDDSGYVVRVNGNTELLVGTAKPDFTTYFKVIDVTDGEIAVTKDMITDNVDMSKVGSYTVKLSCENSRGNHISETFEVKVVNSLSVSEAIKLLGSGTPAYINGYVAGYSVEDGARKAIILQDTVTGECIEFWGSDSDAYNEIWSGYAVGDHVTIHTKAIVDNKGLPRADKTVTPMEINGSYKLSAGNPIQVTEITDMDAFLNSVYSDGANALGVYTCTVTVENSNYFHEVKFADANLRIQLKQSVVNPTMEVGETYKIKFVLTGYSKSLDNTGNLYVRVSVMEEGDVTQVVEIPDDTEYTVSVNGETELLVGTEKPDFTSYFTIVDAVDGEIAVTSDMITDNVDMTTVGTYEVKLSCLNSKGKQITETLEIKVVNSLGVSEAIAMMGTNTPVYINGYVAGYSEENGTRKAVILQDTVTGECIEFWGSDSEAYNEIWSSYAVGDHVTIHAESIVDNKGLPRANKTVTPMKVNGSYKHSTGNAIQVTEIADMDVFLKSVYSDGANTLGVYTCNVTVLNADYFHEIALENGTLRIQLKQSVVTPIMEVGKTYTMKFVLTGYSKALSNSGNLYVRVSVMEEEDVTQVVEIPDDAEYTVSISGETELLVGTAKPDFTSYFTVVDSVDGEITVTSDMITDNVDMSKAGTYAVKLACQNSEGKQITYTLEIKVVNSLSVSEAIALLGTDTPAYINGYVAGYSVDGGTRKAIVLQDTVTGECIEFWGSDSGAYNEVWSTYCVGDHVTIHAESIVDNKGLPRANKTVTPIAINGSYKMSSGNALQVIPIGDMDAFLNSVYYNGANTLGVYVCTVTVANTNYFHEIETPNGKLRIQLNQSAVLPNLEVGKTYTMKFVLTGYNKALTNSGNLYVRVTVMDESWVSEYVETVEKAEYTVSINGKTELLAGTAKPDFKTYFTIVDSVDGQITITDDMITDNVNMSTAGTYQVELYCKNSENKVIHEILEITVFDSMGVSEAVQLLGTGTPAYINGYVAGYSVDGDIRKAIILQDTVTGECIEFWGSDSSAYNEVWSTYCVGDHVTIYAESIVDNKGLPRANKTVTPIKINGSYKMSSGNAIQTTAISDMDAFLQSVYSEGANTLGVYTCTVTVADSNYFHEIETANGKLRIQLNQSAVTPTMEVGKTYTIKFVLTGYNKALTNSGNLYVRVTVMDESWVSEYVEAVERAEYTVSISGETELLAGTAKPDFKTYFTIVDSVDGQITITDDMITDNVDMSTAGTYQVELYCTNSENKVISETLEITVFDSLSVSQAIQLLGTETPAYINGYVAGYSVDGGTRKAIILQDTVTGECIEFWGSDSGAYNEIWSSYAVGDHVTIHAESIVDNKGLPRANKTVTPIEINGSYKISSGNAIQTTVIEDMDAFLNSVYSDGANTLGVYTCTATVANSNYFYEIATAGGKLRIQLNQSAVTPTMEVGKTYTIKFVLTGYSKALSNSGNLYVRVSIMNASDVTEITEASNDAEETVSIDGVTEQADQGNAVITVDDGLSAAEKDTE